MLIISFIVLLVGSSVLHGTSGAAVVSDFDTTVNHYELIYHAQYHLLLALHDNDCYYINVPAGREENLIDDAGMIRNRLEITENSLFTHIRRHDGLTSSSLEAVRDKYGDRLADFHCLGKTIYEVDLFVAATQTPATTPTPHQSTFVCATHTDGHYAYDGDCRKYIVCVFGTSFIETCAPGTLFSAATKQCAINPPCP